MGLEEETGQKKKMETVTDGTSLAMRGDSVLLFYYYFAIIISFTLSWYTFLLRILKGMFEVPFLQIHGLPTHPFIPCSLPVSSPSSIIGKPRGRKIVGFDTCNSSPSRPMKSRSPWVYPFSTFLLPGIDIEAVGRYM